MVATGFHRQDGDWIGHPVGPHDTLHLPEIGLERPLAAIDEGVEVLPGPAPSAAAS